MERFNSSRYEDMERAFRALHELDRVLFELVERGPELDPEYKKNLRRLLRVLLQDLGISLGGEKGVYELTQLRIKMNMPGELQATPPGFPTKEEFERSLRVVIESPVGVDLPPLPARLTAQDVASNAQYSWSEVKGRDTTALDYLYGLGKVMAVPYMYQEFFSETDRISIGDNWLVENGRHRSLVLRILGRRFVGTHGMNDWVLVQKEK